MRPTAGPVASVIDLNPSPLGQFAWNILPGHRVWDLLIKKVRAAPCNDQVDELPLETGIDGEYPLWVRQSILRVC